MRHLSLLLLTTMVVRGQETVDFDRATHRGPESLWTDLLLALMGGAILLGLVYGLVSLIRWLDERKPRTNTDRR